MIIGVIELLGMLVDQTGISSGPLVAIANIPLDYAGYGMVGLFIVSWLIALAIWRVGRIEEKWSARLSPAPSYDAVATQDSGRRRWPRSPPTILPALIATAVPSLHQDRPVVT